MNGARVTHPASGGGTPPGSPSGAANDAVGDRRARAWCLSVTAVLLVCGAVLTALVEGGWGPLADADRTVAQELHRAAVGHPAWTRTNRVLTDWVWDPITMRLLTLAVVGYLAWRRLARLALWVLTTSLVGLGLQSAVKAATARPRPHWPDPVDSAHNWAFPSGHVMTATLTCALLVALYAWCGPRGGAGRAAVWGAGVFSVLGVGFTRVFLGVHWLTDVFAGWLFGVAVVTGCAAAFSPWRGCPAPRST